MIDDRNKQDELSKTNIEILESEENLYLEHYGTPRRSGRYPWGSGDNPYQRTGDFLSRYEKLKDDGLSKTEIAKAMGMSTTKLKAYFTIARQEKRADMIRQIRSLKDDGVNNVEIANQLGLKGESSVRSLLNEDAEARMNIAEKTSENLRDVVDQKGMVDIGVGVQRQLGISQERMSAALEILKIDGYEVRSVRVPQATNPGKFTTVKVLSKPGVEYKELYDYKNIGSLEDYISRDGGDTFEPSFQYPASMSSKRLGIRYLEEGGSDRDGVVEIRRGVKDLSLGNSTYSQVRILVDGTHYIKGMAVYSDNLPDGVDLMFNTNKKAGTPKMEVLKKIKDDPDNPFGSAIKEHGGQSYFINDKGEKQLSLINKRSDEGDWDNWSRELSSQFLSKQPMKMIKRQLDISTADKRAEYDEIMSLTNPTVKKALLESYADDCDAASVQLKAASLPGVSYKVILPITTLKDGEVYAPHLQDGSQVALVRYPHGGTFEIPIVTVNNRNKDGVNILTKNPCDAIGINSKVAARLSGADFDGDTVMCIPLNDRIKIKSTPALKQLEGFDPKMAYGATNSKNIDGTEAYFRGNKRFKVVSEAYGYKQMGVVSNLITDMTLKGATQEELARAVKHSMVMIDAHKHKLDYRQSEIDNGISALKKKYQSQFDENGKLHYGASTLISKAKGEKAIFERNEGAYFAKDTGNRLTLIDSVKKLYFDESTDRVYTEKEKRTLYSDPKTGEKLYHETGRRFNKATYTTKDGRSRSSSVYVKEGGKFKIPSDNITLIKDNTLYFKDEDGAFVKVTKEKLTSQRATQKSTNMAEIKDARLLSSGTPQEEAYATYANNLKALANDARKQILVIKGIPYSPSARKAYEEEVKSLNYKLNQALLNAPRERKAQTIAASNIRARKLANPGLTNDQIKKISQQELVRARQKVGARRREVNILPKEWEAIQAGAISKTKLTQIIANANLDILRQLAMPRNTTVLSTTKIRRITNMSNSGYTTSEIAQALGVSVSTVNKYLKGDE